MSIPVPVPPALVPPPPRHPHPFVLGSVVQWEDWTLEPIDTRPGDAGEGDGRTFHVHPTGPPERRSSPEDVIVVPGLVRPLVLRLSSLAGNSFCVGPFSGSCTPRWWGPGDSRYRFWSRGWRVPPLGRSRRWDSWTVPSPGRPRTGLVVDVGGVPSGPRSTHLDCSCTSVG